MAHLTWGGLPDMPPGQAWPRRGDLETYSQEWNHPEATPAGSSLPFLAQINLAEVAPHDASHLLPAQGALLFFCDAYSGTWSLLLRADVGTSLERVAFPKDLPEDRRYPEHCVEPRPELTLPAYGYHGSYGGDQHQFFDVLDPILSQEHLDKAEQNAYREVQERLQSMQVREHHRMLGWAEHVQNPVKVELQTSTGAWLDDGTLFAAFYDQDDPRPAALRAEAEAADWTLLLQIDSFYPEPSMIWGDGGTHYLWIRGSDLRRADFPQVRYDLQMG